jgi:uncharacterized protein YlxW (UPF0749 family)
MGARENTCNTPDTNENKNINLDLFQERVKNLDGSVKDLKDEIKEFRTVLQTFYVSKEEFDPVKKVVYGAVGVAGGALVLALVYLVIK